MVPTSSPNDARLLLYVALGAVLGGGYVLFDAIAEHHMREGTLTGVMAHVHTLVDRLSPVCVGVLLGVSAHYVQLRGSLSNAETVAARARAEVQTIERDQAVWVVAAAVLHELNNPVHAIGLLADELSELDSEANMPPRRRSLVARIQAQVDQARGHLHALRAMRTSGEPDVQGVSLERVIARLADDIGPVAAEDGLVVQVGCERPVEAHADPIYVRVILESLVRNALASLRESGGRRVAVRLSEESDRAIVRVSDDGAPIAAGEDSVLFEPLRTTKAHGLGLGLAVSRALARAMHGDLFLERSEDKTFRLELPLREGS